MARILGEFIRLVARRSVGRTILLAASLLAVCAHCSPPKQAVNANAAPRLGVATRPIEEWEALLHGIEGSDAIFVGLVQSSTEELMEVLDPQEPGNHALVAFTAVQVDTILFDPLGELSGTNTIHLIVPGGRLEWFSRAQTARTPVMLFIRQYPVTKAALSQHGDTMRFDFANVWKADVPGEGAFHVAEESLAAITARVTRAVELSRPLHLARVADVVIRGHHEGVPSVRRGNGVDQICANIVVDEVLYGKNPGGPLAVYTAVPGYVRTEESVYFLRSTPEGSYEVVGLGGGVRPVSGGRFGHREDDLAEFRRQLARVDGVTGR